MSHDQTGPYTYEFSDGDHAAAVLDALGRFYVGGEFTDVTLRCGESGRAFRCHRALLSARSRYFRAMFTADMRERSDGAVTLAGVDGGVLAALLDYVYTARVSITEANVQSLLEAADRLQFAAVKRACEAFLARRLDVGNCLGMLAFARLHLCPALERQARRVLLSRFSDLTRQDEFLELDLDRVGSVLGGQGLAAVADAVARWVTHDWDGRVQHAAGLLRSIRPDLDQDRLRAVLETPLSGEGDFRSLVVRALTCDGREAPPRSGKASPCMYVVGGYYWHPLSEVHIWDPVKDSWRRGQDLPDHARESYGVALLGASVYVSGGYRTNTVEALDAVEVYDCDADRWAEAPPMITPRYYHCSVALHGCVYAIGGYRGGAPEREAELYDPLKKKWFPVAKMIQGVGNATACVAADKIYVTGGHYGYRGSCTYEKIQVYRPDVNEWSILTVSPHPEYGLCCVSLGNKLYLVGGQTPAADCYDTDRDEWTSISEMKERRMECGAAVIDGCIYVTGGYSYSKGTYLQSIEKYDPELDRWETVGDLPGPARSHGCISVYSL